MKSTNTDIALSRSFKRGLLAPLLLIAVGSFAAACAENESESLDVPFGAPSAAAATRVDEINPRLLKRFRPLDGAFTTDGSPPSAPRVALGKMLFQETALSSDHTLSCQSCHDLAKFGVDGQAVSTGVGAQHGKRNAPSVYNAAGEFLQFWDGRADTVELQALGPMLNPGEMALPDGSAAIAAIRSNPTYEAAFRDAFPAESNPMTFQNMGIAIGAFERTLVTPSRWDKFLAGDHAALTKPEKDGLKTFLNSGCMVCHTGALVGGGMFERVGVVDAWPNQSDQGRWEVTHQEGDRMMFKVPSLRNVERTGPYFHDGSIDKLEDAVRAMGHYQLGIDLAPAEVDSITTWLKTLTGESTGGATVSGASVKAPAPSVPSAPAPVALSCAQGGSCPLQAWMRGNAAPAMAAGDAARLERMFTRLSGLGPPELGRWSELAQRGAEAARQNDLDGCRAACMSCHEAYGSRYRATDRARALR